MKRAVFLLVVIPFFLLESCVDKSTPPLPNQAKHQSMSSALSSGRKHRPQSRPGQKAKSPHLAKRKLAREQRRLKRLLAKRRRAHHKAAWDAKQQKRRQLALRLKRSLVRLQRLAKKAK